MARICTITANPLLNFVSQLPIVLGQVNRIESLQVAAEGKGINVAAVLSRLGHETLCCGLAGGPLGELLVERIKEMGLHPAFTQTDARLRTGFMTAPLNQSHPTTILEHGFTVTADEVDAFITNTIARIHTCDMTIICGSVPDPCVARAYPALIEASAKAGIPCWVDSYGPGMQAALKGPQAPDLAKPNRQEYHTCQGWDRVPELHLSNGGGQVLVTMGDLHIEVEPPRVEQVNPIGSGDCYLAALAHARISGWDWDEQVRFACAAGAANAARADVARIEMDDITALLRSVRIHK